ncbi:class I SAM-dependent methyltransferase [Brevundimonas sp.]|uniref:SAM-dependent methyltransferase n=1 Tax=Brevundimonas sp. TaxID=1871086 RepID=UPI002BE263A4|nr:class I SAM-dependent methyltransferase [Brevundimonas sp.]HWQ87249.1 class I SAM-dependent methyltransferase [Brevundimonas sp.]
MPMTFPRIAYEALEVCNGVTMAAIEAAVAHARLAAGARVLDIGAGNAAVAIRLAEVFGLKVTAIEMDPGMADLARSRVAGAGIGDQVALVVAPAAEVLARTPPVDLITALGTTNVTGEGRPTPGASFAALRRILRPGGWLLWGDLVWLSEPPAPLRRIVEATNLYADHEGWQAAARMAGFVVVVAEISPQAVFDDYARDLEKAARQWLEENPAAPEAEPVRLNADRVRTMLEYGRDHIGFGLYLLRNPR